MSLESATYINGLVATNPTASDPKAQGDDHIRLLKSTIQASFPAVSGPVSASHTELSLLDGLTAQPAAKDGSNLTTPTVGDSSTKIATTEFVMNAALSASLPGQAGNAGYFLQTNGTSASWKQVYPSITGNAGKYLTTDGTTTSWASVLPSLTGNAGKVLSTDGTSTSWTTPTTVGLVPLGSYVVGTAVASIDFLSLFSSTYDKYVIEVQGVVPSAQDVLRLQLASSGTVITSANYSTMTYGGSTAAISQNSVRIGSTNYSTSAGRGGTFTVEVKNANSAYPKCFSARGVFYTFNSVYETLTAEGLYAGTDIASGFRLSWIGGANFTAGTVRVYGVRN